MLFNMPGRAFCTLSLTLLAAAPAYAGETLVSGKATVEDGDTILLDGRRFDLAGIDAPELAQTCGNAGEEWNCGAEAAQALAKFIAGRTVDCVIEAADRSANMVAVCLAGSTDLGEAMVSGGMALALPDAEPAYIAAHERLKNLRFGLWRGPFTPPADWRAAHLPPPAAPKKTEVARKSAAPVERPVFRERVYRNQFGCAIKGNRNYKGEWIYHLPGKPHYDKTRPEELFCTESEARNAGYRRSKA